MRFYPFDVPVDISSEPDLGVKRTPPTLLMSLICGPRTTQIVSLSRPLLSSREGRDEERERRCDGTSTFLRFRRSVYLRLTLRSVDSVFYFVIYCTSLFDTRVPSPLPSTKPDFVDPF